ncbi:MAG: DUF5011 domain-containing protein, partial [Ferrimonas sp.]
MKRFFNAALVSGMLVAHAYANSSYSLLPEYGHTYRHNTSLQVSVPSQLTLQASQLPEGTSVTLHYANGDRHLLALTDGEQTVTLPHTGAVIVAIERPQEEPFPSAARLQATLTALPVPTQSRVVLGSDDRERLACYQGTDIYRWGLSAGASGTASGSAIGSSNFFMSNHHVMGNAGPVSTFATFNVHHRDCGDPTTFHDNLVFSVSENLFSGRTAPSGQDYTFFKLHDFDFEYAEFNRLFGGLKLAEAEAHVGMELVIPQGYHRNMVGKRIDDGSPCSLLALSGTTLTYNCDTSGGSSGSPVINHITGEVVGVHYAGSSAHNIAVKLSTMKSDYPEEFSNPAHYQQSLPVDHPIRVRYAAHSTFAQEDMLIEYEQSVYFDNPALRITHQTDHSLIYLAALDEETDQVDTALLTRQPLIAWVEHNLKHYPINAVIPEASKTRLHIRSPYQEERLIGRSWLPLDVFLASGELHQHLITKLTLNWFDTFSAPFDVSAPEVRHFKLTHELLTGSSVTTISVPTNNDVFASFYPAQGPTFSIYNDNDTTYLPIVLENIATQERISATIRGYKSGICGSTSIHSQGGCPGHHNTGNFAYHPTDNRHLPAGQYRGILPIKHILYPTDEWQANILIELDITVPDAPEYQTVVLYSEPNYQGESIKLTNNADLEEHDFAYRMSSFTIPNGYQVRFYNDSNGYWTRDSSNNASGFENQTVRVQMLATPVMQPFMLSLPSELPYVRGEPITLDQLQLSPADNSSYTYEWQFAAELTAISATDEAQLTLLTPMAYAQHLPVQVSVNDGLSTQTAQILLSALPSEAPVLSGIYDVHIPVGQYFDPLAGVQAMDDFDDDLTAQIVITGQVNTFVAGEYALHYAVLDFDGNRTEQRRTVHVIAPSPEAEQFSQTTIISGQPFDPMDGLIVGDPMMYQELYIIGEVDPNTAGIYTLRYVFLTDEEIG